MRNWIGLLLLTLVVGVLPFSPTVSAQTTDWPAIIRAVRPAVVWILAETRDGVDVGTGAIISSDGYILTADHVIDDATGAITVIVEEAYRYTASVISSDADSDIAILKIPATGLTWVPLGDSDQVDIEEEIRVFGYPLPGAGVGLIVVRGVIQGIRVRDGVRWLQHNATTAGGHSGGPVINSQGQMIGIHSAVLVDQPEYRLATAVNEARRFIPSGVLPVGAPTITPRPPTPTPPSPTPTAPSGMVLIPAGSFRMGNAFSGEGDSDERPVHEVYVSAFYMDTYEVTKALWDEVASWAQANGYDIKPSDGSGKAPNHPVYNVSWHEAVKWCNARSEKEGRTPAYYTSSAKTTVYRTGQVDVQNDWVRWDSGYRLPTEAEWEKAARGGCEGRRFPWCDTDTIQHSRANYQSDSRYSYDTSPTRGYHPTYKTGSSPYTSPVGSFAPNGYGLYDMAGNVTEWCWDSYWGVGYLTGERVDPRGPGFSSTRVLRGGAWSSTATYCGVAYRLKAEPRFRSPQTPGGADSIGFRLVRRAL